MVGWSIGYDQYHVCQYRYQHTLFTDTDTHHVADTNTDTTDTFLADANVDTDTCYYRPILQMEWLNKCLSYKYIYFT